MDTSQMNHQQLALWAAACANCALAIFEAESNDERPRKAIEAARAWAEGKLKMTEARQYAFAAHAAARAVTHQAASAAARSAGHAAATAHVATHAKYAVSYALKAVKDDETLKEKLNSLLRTD